MHITAIELENFKGISDRVRVELKPITLLFGANSAGKSTILQALQYFREILERRNANPDRTLYGGEFVDLGGFRNLVHGRDTSRRIAIQISLSLDDEGLPELMPQAFEGVQANGEEVEPWVLLTETLDRVDSISLSLEIAWNSLRDTAFVVGYHIGANGQWLARIDATTDRDYSLELNQENPIFLRELVHESESGEKLTVGYSEALRIVHDDLNRYKQSASEEAEEPPDLDALGISALSKFLDIQENAIIDDTEAASEVSWLPWILERMHQVGMDDAGNGLRAWLTDFDSALPRLGALMEIPASNAKSAEDVYRIREFTAFLSSLIIGPGVLLLDELRTLRYLGPIRNVPDREFQRPLTPDEARWADGTAAWDVLLADNTVSEDTTIPMVGSLVKEVSDWLANPEKLNTGYGIQRESYKEVDVASLSALLRSADPDTGGRFDRNLSQTIEGLPEKRRLFLVDARFRQRMAARDVGIGISQVLPVVVAALEPSVSMVCIEQPELHIHPAIQVGLGDLFIEGALKRGTQFLIETHSEHLILRLLRRVRETTDGELPPGLPEVKPEHMGVLYVDNGESGMRITPLPIDETGEFKTRWPKGFFVERGEELF